MGGGNKDWMVPVGIIGATMLAGPAGAALAGTAAGAGGAAAAGAGAAGAAGAGAAGASGLGATLGGVGSTALGTSSALGSGLSMGAGGLGMTAPASALGMGEMTAAPGMAGALGTGITGVASTAPTAGGMLASAATPSSFTTPFTVGDAMGKAGSGLASYGKANMAMKAAGMDPMGSQQQRPMQQARPVFQGEQAPISPFGQSGQSGQGISNRVIQMIMQKRMGSMYGLNNGLLG